MPSDPKAVLARFQPMRLAAELDLLAPDVRAALPHLVGAMRAMDDAYLEQLGKVHVDLARRFDRASSDAAAQAFWLYKSPYDKLDEDRPFIEGVAPASPGRALYPSDLTADELDRYVASHPLEKDRLLDPYTVVARHGAGLKAVPYPEAFAGPLSRAAAELEAAAAMIAHPGLRSFLSGRARALTGRAALADSDADWVRLRETPLEVVIGPFEVYQDHLRGVKAFYEGMLLVVIPEACARIASIEHGLADLARAFACPKGSRPAVGGMAPLVVADEIVATGEGHSGLLASAFNLPNDPGVRGSVGWKQIMIRNVMNAKFEACTRRIASRVLTEAQHPHLSFDAYFYFVLLHEVSHGLGPAFRADGRSTNEACGKAYTPLEEAKADIGGLTLLMSMGGRHGIPAFEPETVAASYLAGLYRSARFGLMEAHGRANVIQYAFLKERGALRVCPGGRIEADASRIADAGRALLERLCELQAAGTPEELAGFLERYGRPPEELAQAIAGLADLPVDILPVWPAV